jgi:predicted ATP-grasp superfamily ATP-dependent carboligase
MNDDYTPEHDDARIDWERKQRNKRQSLDEEEVLDDAEDLIDEVLAPKVKKSGKARKKKRHLVYDEERGKIVTKRKRRRSQPGKLEDYLDEFDDS